MSGITIYEFDALAEAGSGFTDAEGLHAIPENAFLWLEGQSLRATESGDAAWIRYTQRRGRRAIQVTSFVGVIRTPDGFQIEVLPKIGRALGGSAVEARKLLIDMLSCLQRFRHIQTENAKLLASRMPLLEVFIGEFLRAVEQVVKRGLRSDYVTRQDNLFALRGKLKIAAHLQQNVCRADRFYTEHDEFSTNRAENRLLKTALHRVLSLSTAQSHQQLARELTFVFGDISCSDDVWRDFQNVRPDRGMAYYALALAWARLILEDSSPLTGTGRNWAPSLLFPMEAVFEAFVAKHIGKRLASPLRLKVQARSCHLVRHKDQKWFQLKPDMLIQDRGRNLLVLDTKWKLLDGQKPNGAEKYGLAQGDFYQLQAYGHTYLEGKGDVILIYPMTEAFNQPLPVFEFIKSENLRLWVLPFCLKSRQLSVPDDAGFAAMFN
jgi:5-methylcytosine-specific restriction enzyme subunit McrC